MTEYHDFLDAGDTDWERRAKGFFVYNLGFIVDDKNALYRRDVNDVLSWIEDGMEDYDGKIPELTISLRYNFITHIGLAKILNFVLAHEDILRNLVLLDLSSNKVTASGLEEIKELIDAVFLRGNPKLKISLQINKFEPSDVQAILGEQVQKFLLR